LLLSIMCIILFYLLLPEHLYVIATEQVMCWTLDCLCAIVNNSFVITNS